MSDWLTPEELTKHEAHSRDVARICKAQFDAMLEVGFDKDTATHLTSTWLMANISAANERNMDG